jgi:uncharacterized protein
MGKIIFWLVVVFVALFVLRLSNAAKLKVRARQQADALRRQAAAGEPMVRCNDCGVYLPRSEAVPTAGGFHCPAGSCGQRR